MITKTDTQEIKLTDIVFTPNTRIEPEDIADLVTNMKALGQINPVTVIKRGNKYHLIAGNRRFLAAKRLGWKTIRATIATTQSSSDELNINICENVVRSQLTPYEIGAALYLVMEKEKLKPLHLTARFAMTEEQIKDFVLIYTKLPEKYRKKIILTGKGRKAPAGTVSAHTALRIIKESTRYKYKQNKLSELFDVAIKERLTAPRAAHLVKLKKDRVETTKAVKQIKSIRDFTIDISISEQVCRAYERHYGKSINQIIKDHVYKRFSQYQMVDRLVNGRTKRGGAKKEIEKESRTL